MSRSVAICEASLPDNIPNKGQLCRTAGAIDRNISAVSGMLDQLYRRMAALLQTNRDMQARLRRMEQGADPAMRQEIQRVRQQYQAAIDGTARVLQDIRRRIKGVAVEAGPGGAPAAPGLLGRAAAWLGGKAPSTSAAPAPPSTAAAVPPSTAAPAPPSTAAPAPPSSAAPAPPPTPLNRGAAPDVGLTLTDLVNAYTYFPASYSPQLRGAQIEFIDYLSRKQAQASSATQLADITQLLEGLTASPQQRRVILEELINKKLRQIMGGAFTVDFAPSRAATPSLVRELLQMLLVAHWGRYGSFVRGNVVSSLRILQEAVDKYLNPTVFNRSLVATNLQADVQGLPLLNDNPALAEELYAEIVKLTPAMAGDVDRAIQGTLTTVQRVNSQMAQASVASSSGPAASSVPVARRIANIFSRQ